MRTKEININSRYRKEYEAFPKKVFFDSFRKKYKEYSKYDDAYLKDILKSVQENFTDLLCQNKEGIELPYGLGNIRIFSFKPSKSTPHVNFTMKPTADVTFKFTNIKTDGLMCKIGYSNRYSRVKFNRSEIWCLKSADKLRDKVSKHFVENYEMYTKLKGIKLSSYFNKR